MKKIGITGGIGSGKSTVARVFQILGVPVYDADSRAKFLMTHSESLTNQIRSIFGDEAYNADGSLNRKFIADLAFKDKNRIAALNSAVHPAVFADFDQWCESHSNKPYILKEAALMFESDSYKQLDQIITVTAPQELRILRTIKRDNTTREAVLARINNQLSEEEKVARSAFVIVNDEVSSVILQVINLHNHFTK